jgi:hypothetical protein
MSWLLSLWRSLRYLSWSISGKWSVRSELEWKMEKTYLQLFRRQPFVNNIELLRCDRIVGFKIILIVQIPVEKRDEKRLEHEIIPTYCALRDSLLARFLAFLDAVEARHLDGTPVQRYRKRYLQWGESYSEQRRSALKDRLRPRTVGLW